MFAVALAARLLYLAQVADYPAFDQPIVDAATYHDLARGWAAGQPISEGFFWQPFFYPFVLGLLYHVAGPSVLAARLVQLVLGAFTCLLTFHLGRRLAGERTGLVAGLMAALYMPLIVYEADLVAAGWAAFWAALILLLLLQAAERPRAGLALATGFVAALAVLTRPTFLPFVAASSLWLAWRWRRSAGAIGRVVLLAVGFALPALPVAALNHKVTGHFGMLPCSGGLNLYVGNNPDPCRTLTIRPGSDWDTLTSEPARDGVLETWAQDRYFRNRVAEFAREQPRAWLAGLGAKALRFVSSRELPRNEDPYVMRAWSTWAAVAMWKIGRFGFPFGLIFPLACIGLVALRRSWPGPVWLFMLLYPAAVILVFVSARYRVPTLPLWLILAASGAVWLVEQRRWRALAGGAIAIALTLPGPFCEENVRYDAELYQVLAGARYRQGDRDGAMADARRALELDPRNVEARHTLGVIQAGGGDRAAAVRTFAAVLKQRPDHPDARFYLGSLQMEAGRMDEAARLLEGAVPLRPRQAELRQKYGIALAELGRTDEAASEFAVALALQPDLPDLHFNLGMALLDLGKPRDAIRHLREEVRREPDDAAAWVVLGRALLADGQRRQAVAAQREALRRQPGWPETREGYARALLAESGERLDEDETNLYARAADLADQRGDREAAALLRPPAP